MVELEKLYWRDVRARVHKLNPKLATAIDEVDPPDDCFFFLAKYQYGDKILEKGGTFNLPTHEKTLVDLTSPNVPDSVRSELNYNRGTNPAMLLLNKTVELFVQLNDQVIPSYIFHPGDYFGMSIALDERYSQVIPASGVTTWDMTAGARSTFLLPKTTDSNGHRRIQEHYNINQNIPSSSKDHWKIFKEISSHTENTWQFECLLFSKNWYLKLTQKHWLPLRICFLENLHSTQSYWRNIFPWSIAFTRIHHKKNIKSTSHIANFVKNIFGIGAGGLIAYQPAIDELMLPLKSIQEAYTNIYTLAPYAPIVMQPNYLRNGLNDRPVYTSILYPITGFELATEKPPSSIKVMDQIHYVMEKHIEELRSGEINVDTPYLKLASQYVDFNYFHTSPGNYDFIRPAAELPFVDDNFNCAEYSNLEFPYTSKFFKGCIQIKFNQHFAARTAS